jgi:alginate O-acetyltransferase complex protein AlgI
MFFNSQAYLLFFAAVMAAYWATSAQRVRTLILLVASYFFYYFWSPQLALLVAGTTFADYLFARGIDRFQGGATRKFLLAASLSMNLGLLCYFKYANFFLDSLRQSLSAVGVTASIPYLEVVLPFGISFYTFEAISYTIDVYRRKIAAEKNLLHFMLFILFFPHLVAGPIVRARDFLPQIARRKRWSWLRAEKGVQLFLVGLLKKVVADRMAIYSDPVFAHPEEYASGAVWLGVIAFSIRIYCDFSGYSDMALGSAHLLGFKLTQNFNLPYVSLNVSEFWRRWHISLSTWLRDYVFIPLGGSRGSGLLTSRNLMITMLLGGLWHGANWSYVVWGGLHGLFLVVHRVFRDWSESRPGWNGFLQSWLGTFYRRFLTLVCVTFAWIFFQPSLAKAMTILERLATLETGKGAPIPSQSLWMLGLGFAAVHLACGWDWLQRSLRQLPPPVVGVSYALLLSFTLLITPQGGAMFLYFTF